MGTIVAGKAYARYAWMLFLPGNTIGLIAVLLVFGSSYPDSLSAFDLIAAPIGLVLYVATTIMAVTAFRKGRRWAWYIMWSLIVYFAALILDTLTAFEFNLFLVVTVFTVLALLGLLLPYRKFFPKT